MQRCSKNVKTSHAATKALRLQERVVGATEHSLGLTKCVNLAVPGLFAHIKVLHQPIALSVEGADVLDQVQKLFSGGLLGVGVALQSCLRAGLVTILLRVLGRNDFGSRKDQQSVV